MHFLDNFMEKNKENLFKSVEFWSDIIKILDGRVKEISTTYGFGEVNLRLVIRQSKIKDVIFAEEVMVRQKDADAED